MNKLTPQDRKILSFLDKDGRITFSELAARAGLSKTACWTRVKSLQDSGIIQGYSIDVDPKDLGLTVLAFVRLSLDFSEYERFEALVCDHPLIQTCHAVTGENDYLLNVVAKDLTALDTFLRNELAHMPGVNSFATTIMTRTVKSRRDLGLTLMQLE